MGWFRLLPGEEWSIFSFGGKTGVGGAEDGKEGGRGEGASWTKGKAMSEKRVGVEILRIGMSGLGSECKTAKKEEGESNARRD